MLVKLYFVIFPQCSIHTDWILVKPAFFSGVTADYVGPTKLRPARHETVHLGNISQATLLARYGKTKPTQQQHRHSPIKRNVKHKINTNRMWANAQRHGHPAEYTWRPLFNAANFGWRPLLEYRAVTLPRCETRWNLQGCRCTKLPNRSQLLVGRSSPYYGDIWRTYCYLTSFFSDCRHRTELRRYSPTKLCDGAQMAIFGDFFCVLYFSEPRTAHFRPAF